MRTPWTVRRLWWELTKMIICLRGGYDVYATVTGLSEEAQREASGKLLVVSFLAWEGGEDRFANIEWVPDPS